MKLSLDLVDLGARSEGNKQRLLLTMLKCLYEKGSDLTAEHII